MDKQRIKDALARAEAASVGPWEGQLSAQDSEFIATILGEALQAYRDLQAALEALETIRAEIHPEECDDIPDDLGVHYGFDNKVCDNRHCKLIRRAILDEGGE